MPKIQIVEAPITQNIGKQYSNMKFKTASKKLAKEEDKANKLGDKGGELMDANNPKDQYEVTAFNAGRLNMLSWKARKDKVDQEKERLAEMQTSILELADIQGVDPKEIKFAKNGAVLDDPRKGRKPIYTMDKNKVRDFNDSTFIHNNLDPNYDAAMDLLMKRNWQTRNVEFEDPQGYRVYGEEFPAPVQPYIYRPSPSPVPKQAPRSNVLFARGGKLNPNSVVDYLSSKGQDSSKGARQALAKKLGIKDYDFSASKNIELLSLLKGRPQATPLKPITQTSGKSIYKSNNDFSSALKTASKSLGYVPEGKLESGTVIDKRKGKQYVIQDGKVVRINDVLTGKNPEGNRNMGNVSSVKEEGKTTPVGYYKMEGLKDNVEYKQKSHYKGLIRSLNPIEYPGVPKPEAESLAQHLTYDPKNRNKYYGTDNPYATYGCVNCKEPDMQDLIKRFPQGDTTRIVDSKMPEGEAYLKKYGIKENGGKLQHYDDGGKIKARKAYLKQLADKYGVDYQIMEKLVMQESGFRADAKSRIFKKGKEVEGARGIMQFMSKTAEKYGVDNILGSSNEEDIKKVMDAGVRHFKDLLKTYNNDYGVALGAYNGGPGVVEWAKKKLKKDNITGDEFVSFLQNEKRRSPSKDRNAWENQTLDYVTAIAGKGDSKKFQQKYGYVIPEGVEFGDTKDLLPNPEISTEKIMEKTGRKYNPPLTDAFTEAANKKLPTNQEGLNPLQILPEAYAIATNQVEPVHLQQYNPMLKQPYQVSFQDSINENNSEFNAIKKIAAYNPEALSILAAGNRGANDKVLAEEFRTNQGISNTIYNDNVNTLNDAQLKNLQLGDNQYVRQSQARSNTRAVDQEALSSISDKYLQNNLNNQTLMAGESMTGMRFVDSDGDGVKDQLQYIGSDASFRIDPVTGILTPTNANKVTLNKTTTKSKLGETPVITEETKEEQLRKIRQNKESGGKVGSFYNQLYGKHR